MQRELPTYNIHGTDFYVDVEKMELREKFDARNRIPFSMMSQNAIGSGYAFGYCPLSRNLDYEWMIDMVTPNTFIPEMKTLDPFGMAIKYNLPLEQVHKMTDFEIMVNQKAYDSRVNQGKLPIIDIKGQLYTIDLLQGQLACDLKVIRLSDMRQYINFDQYAYVIPYNTEKKEFSPLDLDKMVELPKDIVMFSIPLENRLDPVGWNMLCGFPINKNLHLRGFKMKHTALSVAWEKTSIPSIIEQNLKKIKWREDRNLAVRMQNRRKKNKGFRL